MATSKFSGIELAGVEKEIYLEKMLLAITSLNSHLAKEDQAQFSSNIYYNERVKDLLQLYRLASLENGLQGGSKHIIEVGTQTGFPIWNELIKVKSELMHAKDDLKNLLEQYREQGTAYNQATGAKEQTKPALSARAFFAALAKKTAEELLSGHIARNEKKDLRTFLNSTRLISLLDERGEPEEMKRKKVILSMINDDQYMTSRIIQPQTKNAPGVYTIEQFKLHKQDMLWTYLAITFQQQNGFFSKDVVEHEDGTVGTKGSIAKALSLPFEDERSLTTTYRALAAIDDVQPLELSMYTLGPFYHPKGFKNMHMSKLFTEKPDSFILQYGYESVIANKQETTNGKFTPDEQPLRYIFTCTSEIGIDFEAMMNKEKKNVVEINEIRPEKASAIKENYVQVNPRFAEEYQLRK